MSSLSSKIRESLENNKSEIFNAIADIMETTFSDPVYKAVCENCNTNLEFSVTRDSDGDATVFIEPCSCQKEM